LTFVSQEGGNLTKGAGKGGIDKAIAPQLKGNCGVRSNKVKREETILWFDAWGTGNTHFALVTKGGKRRWPEYSKKKGVGVSASYLSHNPQREPPLVKKPRPGANKGEEKKRVGVRWGVKPSQKEAGKRRSAAI